MKSSFASRVAEAIRASGMNQTAIAVAAKTTKGQVSQWATEGGVNPENVKADVLFRICDTLKVRPRWLLYGVPPMSNSEFQNERLDDATIAQGVELLYLLADARPEDKRLRRPSWAMIQIAGKAIKLAEGNSREAMSTILAELNKEISHVPRSRSTEVAGS